MGTAATIATCVINGLVLSSMYVLVALGFALLISILNIFNFAHGAIYMVGAFVTYEFAHALGLNQWLAVLISIIILGVVGLFIERFCFRPFSGDVNKTIVMTIAVDRQR